MWVQDCYKQGVPIDSNMIEEKSKSLWQPKAKGGGEGSKAGEFNGSKGWPDKFRKRFDLKYQNNSRSSFWEIKRQQMHSQIPLRKSLGINLVSCKFTNSLMSSSSFLVASLGFSVSSFMPSANSASFTSFPTWILSLFIISACCS